MPHFAGDVISLWDGSIRPPNYKRFLVVYVADGWLFRINTKPHWKPHWPLIAADNGECLEHDSFLELHGVVEYIQSELDQAKFIDRLSDDTIEKLIEHLPNVPTLTEEQCERIISELRKELGQWPEPT
jgi:hypothetical protein